jgi:uncharacterized membrane protein YdbT with pleckstrin-like domain
MNYIDSNLLPNETLVFRGQLHWIVFLNPILFIIAMIFAYDVLTSLQLSFLPSANILFVVLMIAIFGAAITPILLITTTEFGVTNQRIIVKRGFIQRSTSENFLQKVENIQVEQSITGRLLGYGTIIIHGVGGTSEVFSPISAPLTFRNQAQAQIEKVISK